MNHAEQLQQIKELSNQFAEMISTKIDDLANSLDYKNGSRFSYMKDRLNLYLKELNDFEIITESKRNEKPRAIKINQDYFIKTKPAGIYINAYLYHKERTTPEAGTQFIKTEQDETLFNWALNHLANRDQANKEFLNVFN